MDRLVEAEEPAKARDDFRRGDGRLSEELFDHRPRDEPHHAEDEEAHPEEGERDREEPLDEIGAHERGQAPATDPPTARDLGYATINARPCYSIAANRSP